MKTITIKKTLNGNYVTCVLPIRGQQSSEPYVYIFSPDFEFLNKIDAHPLFSWVNYCQTVATICAKNEIEELSEVVKMVVENNVSGYTTAYNLRNGKFMKLLPPLALI